MHHSARKGVAIGFFDGVHLGHRRILSQARAAVTFRNHPLSVLAPEKAPRLIMTFREREAAMRACGVEEVTALDFTPELAAMEPADFARRHLADRTVLCGGNWRFGRGGTGTPALLASLGYETLVAPYAVFKGERISSSRIRSAIEAADLEDANAMLGRPWRTTGRIVSGKGLGRKIGFPTVNLMLDDLQLSLPRGVYAVEALGRRAVANWGVAPTMRENAWTRNTLELHFLDAPPPAMNANPTALEVDFLRFIRPEETFSDVSALKEQIAKDAAAARHAPPPRQPRRPENMV